MSESEGPQGLGQEAMEQAAVGLFRFQMEMLETILDGRAWRLRAGVEYPRLLPFSNLRTRLYQAAHSRGGEVRIARMSEGEVWVQFMPKFDPSTLVLAPVPLDEGEGPPV